MCDVENVMMSTRVGDDAFVRTPAKKSSSGNFNRILKDITNTIVTQSSAVKKQKSSIQLEVAIKPQVQSLVKQTHSPAAYFPLLFV